MLGRFGDDVVTWNDVDYTLEKKNIAHAVSMFELFPALTKRKALFIMNLFKLTEAEYKVQNVIATVSTGLDVEDDLVDLEPIVLDEDCDIGRFMKKFEKKG